MRPWYVRRAEGILKALHPVSLSRVTAEKIAGYLREVSAQAQLTDWQFRQLVDALQRLFVDLAQCSAGNEIDWEWWKADGRRHRPSAARIEGPKSQLSLSYSSVVWAWIPYAPVRSGHRVTRS